MLIVSALKSPRVICMAAFVSLFSIAVTLVLISVRYHKTQVLGREVVTRASLGDFNLLSAYWDLGGSPSVIDRNGFSIAYYATAFGNTDALKDIISRGGNARDSPLGFPDMLELSIANRNIDSLKVLIGSGQWDRVIAEDSTKYLGQAAMHDSDLEQQVRKVFASQSNAANRQ